MKLAQGQNLRVVASALWKKKSIFLFDPHSRTSDGNQAENGQVVLLEFASIRDVNNFIIAFYKRIMQDITTLQYDIFK